MKSEEAGTRSRPAPTEVSLVQLAADGVRVAWPETVAIISQVCRFLIAAETHTFDSSTIVIHQNGDVILGTSTGGGAEQSVHALGELLRARLLGVPHPVPLRNIIAQATCTPPFYRSIAELAEALSYYSGSKPEDVTRSVYERWQRHRRVPEEVPVHVPPRVRRPVVARLRSAMRFLRFLYTTRPTWMTQRVLAITTAILFSIGVAGIAFAAGLGRSAAPALVAKISRANGQATTALASTMGAAFEWIRIRFRPAAPPPADTTVDARSQSAPARRAIRQPSRTPAEVRAIPPRTSNTNLDAAETSRSLGPAGERVAPLTHPAPNLSAETAPSTRHSPNLSAPNDLRVYSADDSDVSAPVPIDRIRSNPLAAFNRQQNAAAITIVVSEDGRVESAAVVGRPATFHDGVAATLNLSAVKSWRFYPAVRTGVPVKYRMTVWLVDQ